MVGSPRIDRTPMVCGYGSLGIAGVVGFLLFNMGMPLHWSAYAAFLGSFGFGVFMLYMALRKAAPGAPLRRF